MAIELLHKKKGRRCKCAKGRRKRVVWSSRGAECDSVAGKWGLPVKTRRWIRIERNNEICVSGREGPPTLCAMW